MEKFKLKEKVILCANIPLGLPNGSVCYISNIHATIDQGGDNYQLFYHLRQNPDDRHETIVTEREIKRATE